MLKGYFLWLVAVSRRVCRLVVPLIFTAIVLVNVGCGLSLAARYPQARIYRVCALPGNVEQDAQAVVITEDNVAISDLHIEAFDQAAQTARVIFKYAPEVHPKAMALLPSPYNQLQCSERYAPLSPPEAGPEWLPEEGLFLADRDERYQQFHKELNDPRKAVIYMGIDPPPLPPPRPVTGGRMAPPPQTSRDREIQDIQTQLTNLGKRYGEVFGTVDGALRSIGAVYMGTYWKQVQEGRAEEIKDMYAWLAVQLNTLPALPTYEDPVFAEAALRAFEAGLGVGFSDAMKRAAALDAACAAALAAAGPVAAVVESVSAKALQAALTRVRSMPLFIPGTVGGAGFFMRVPKALPKPPVANANPPSLPVGVVTPPASTPPFGNLSRAAEFGIKPHSQLVKTIQGTGLEGHHLIEQRFLRYFETDPRMKLSVAVTPKEHQHFTHEWWNQIKYAEAGTYKTNAEAVLAAARVVYKDHPAILKALGL